MYIHINIHAFIYIYIYIHIYKMQTDLLRFCNQLIKFLSLQR